MSTKRKKPKRPAERVSRISSTRLVSGWSGPHGTTVRLAQAGEGHEVTRYMVMAGASLLLGVEAAIDEGNTSTAIKAALDEGSRPVLAELAALGGGHDSAAHFAALTTVLVAEGSDGGILGAFVGMPPFTTMAQGIAGGIRREVMLVAGAVVARFSGLGVDEASRSTGIGSALMRAAIRLYSQLDYKLFYGQIEDGSGLDRYYPRFGFDVRARGEGIPLRDLGIPMGIAPEPGERLITRWA